MSLWFAVILGLIQGAAEFLPVSSSGHLALLQAFFPSLAPEEGLLFDVLLHLGTLVSLAAVYRRQLGRLARSLLRPRGGDGAAGPAAPTGTERIGSALWSWRPAPEGDGAEVVGAQPAFTAGLFRDFPEGAIEWLLEQGDLTVPETLGGMPVAAIGPDAFRDLPPTRLAVPASVRRIGARAVPAERLEKLSFAGAPPALDPEWIARGPGDDDPLDFLECPPAFAREWEAALDPPLPSARPGAAGAAEGAFVGEEEALGVRWTYSVRDGRAWVGAGPGRPAVPPGTAGPAPLASSGGDSEYASGGGAAW